jgi:hypothetical protein
MGSYRRGGAMTKKTMCSIRPFWPIQRRADLPTLLDWHFADHRTFPDPSPVSPPPASPLTLFPQSPVAAVQTPPFVPGDSSLASGIFDYIILTSLHFLHPLDIQVLLGRGSRDVTPTSLRGFGPEGASVERERACATAAPFSL